MAYEKVKIGQTIDENNKVINGNFDETVNIAEKGIPDGIATLDSSGKVPSSQLPEIPMTAKDINMTGYAKPSVTSAIVTTDSADAAIGKLEKKVDDNANSTGQMIAQLSTNIFGLQTSVGNINNDIDTLENDIGDINNKISDIGIDINNMKTNLTELRTETDSNTSAISAIETNINDIDDDMVALGGRISTLEQSGGSGGGNADYTKLADALITMTNANATGGGGANVTAVQPNENDRSIHKLSATTDVAVTDLLLLLSGRNIIPNKMTAWESGEYEAGAGNKATNANRIRLAELHPVIPSTAYYVSTNNTSSTDIRYVVRGYGKNKAFVASIGAVLSGAVMNIPANVYYIGVTIYSITNPAPVFADYQQLFNGGQVKPFVGYNGIQDKTFVSYTAVTRVMLDGLTVNAGDTFLFDGNAITLNEADISGTYPAQLTALKAANLTAVVSSNCKATLTYNRSIVAAFAEMSAVLAAMVGG